jgi:hypothetical protein
MTKAQGAVSFGSGVCTALAQRCGWSSIQLMKKINVLLWGINL